MICVTQITTMIGIFILARYGRKKEGNNEKINVNNREPSDRGGNKNNRQRGDGDGWI